MKFYRLNPAIRYYAKQRAFDYLDMYKSGIEKDLLDGYDAQSIEGIECFCNYLGEESIEYIDLYRRVISLSGVNNEQR